MDDFEIQRYQILGNDYTLKIFRFSEQYDETCYDGFDFILTSDKFELSGEKYDEDDYLTFRQQPMREAKFMFKDVKEILYQAFHVQKFRYWNHKHSCTWYWCYKLDEGIWIEPRFFDEKVKLFDNYDVLRYDGELLEEFTDLLKLKIKQEWADRNELCGIKESNNTD